MTTNFEASHRSDCGLPSNHLCPDFSSHYENAFDYLFPAGHRGPLTVEENEALEAHAEAEYLDCDGHG